MVNIPYPESCWNIFKMAGHTRLDPMKNENETKETV